MQGWYWASISLSHSSKILKANLPSPPLCTVFWKPCQQRQPTLPRMRWVKQCDGMKSSIAAPQELLYIAGGFNNPLSSSSWFCPNYYIFHQPIDFPKRISRFPNLLPFRGPKNVFSVAFFNLRKDGPIASREHPRSYTPSNEQKIAPENRPGQKRKVI